MIEQVEKTSRTVEGRRVTVGGVPVVVEMDHGELSVRVGRADPGAVGEKIDISPETGAGHVNFYVEGETPGETQGTRYRVHQEGGWRGLRRTRDAEGLLGRAPVDDIA